MLWSLVYGRNFWKIVVFVAVGIYNKGLFFVSNIFIFVTCRFKGIELTWCEFNGPILVAADIVGFDCF